MSDQSNVTDMTRHQGGQMSKGFSLAPQSLDEAMKYSEIIAKSDIVPQDYKGNPSNILIAVQMGAELGLPPLQALQNIAVINGRPSVWGDSLIAIARAHPGCEYITETFDDQTMTATCTVKRRGEPEQKRHFSKADAELANLWGKKGPWQTTPKRMLQMRARGFALRDVFPDALRGIALAEESRDIPLEREVNPEPRRETRTELPAYPQSSLDQNMETWRQAVQAEKTTPEAIIQKVETKGTLTEAQKNQIRKLAPIQAEETNDEDA